MSSRSPVLMIGLWLRMNICVSSWSKPSSCPLLVLHQRYRTYQACDRSIVGEGADDADVTVNFPVNGLEVVGAPDLSPVLVKQVAEGKHVISGFDYVPFGPCQTLDQRAGQVIPAGLDFSSLLLVEHLGQRGGDHSLMGFWHSLQHVAGEMDPSALPAAALDYQPDLIGEPFVCVGDLHLDL